MKSILSWARQPSTLLALALLAAAGAYWFTHSTALAAAVAAAILGGVDDQTQDLLARLETMEDALRSAKTSMPISDHKEAAASITAAMAVVKPLAGIAIVTLFSATGLT